MYLLSFLAVVVVSVFTIGLTVGGVTGSWGGAYLYFDTWSFAMLIILCVPILIGSGLFKDFNNAFRLAVKIKAKTETEETEVKQETKKKGKTEASLPEVKHAIEAVSLVRKVLIAGGTFIVLLSLIAIFAYLNPEYYESGMHVVGINTAVALLPLVYAFAVDIFLLPIESRLKVRLNDMMHQ